MDERTAFASLHSRGCDLTFVRRRIASAGQSLYASSLPVFLENLAAPFPEKYQTTSVRRRRRASARAGE
jgi:hypothetical protein